MDTRKFHAIMKHMAKKAVTPGPRDERGVLQARILNAARHEFATHGWAGTTIRAVARAADVDPALVYHYFGSKERLLDAATDPPARWLESVAESWATPRDELGPRLVRTVLGAWTDDEIGPVLRAVVLTAAHDDRTPGKSCAWWWSAASLVDRRWAPTRPTDCAAAA